MSKVAIILECRKIDEKALQATLKAVTVKSLTYQIKTNNNIVPGTVNVLAGDGNRLYDMPVRWSFADLAKDLKKDRASRIYRKALSLMEASAPVTPPETVQLENEDLIEKTTILSDKVFEGDLGGIQQSVIIPSKVVPSHYQALLPPQSQALVHNEVIDLSISEDYHIASFVENDLSMRVDVLPHIALANTTPSMVAVVKAMREDYRNRLAAIHDKSEVEELRSLVWIKQFFAENTQVAVKVTHAFLYDPVTVEAIYLHFKCGRELFCAEHDVLMSYLTEKNK